MYKVPQRAHDFDSYPNWIGEPVAWGVEGGFRVYGVCFSV